MLENEMKWNEMLEVSMYNRIYQDLIAQPKED